MNIGALWKAVEGVSFQTVIRSLLFLSHSINCMVIKMDTHIV